jgi:hypothetical protein
MNKRVKDLSEKEILRRVYPESPSTTLRTGFDKLRIGSTEGLRMIRASGHRTF